MALPYSGGPGAAGAVATATVPARLGNKSRITGCVFSLSVAPAAPVTLAVVGRSSRTGMSVQVVGAGPQSLTFGSTGVEFDPNEIVDGFITAPGGAVVATLTLLADYVPQQ